MVSGPTIAVVIPAHNAAPWIADTLGSVLAQTRSADEIVVVDDGSTDDTAFVAEAAGSAVRVIRQANAGAPAAYNRGFVAAAADYVAMCPADDLWQPDKLAVQAARLAEHPEIDVTFGGARYFGLANEDFPAPPAAGIIDRGVLTAAMYERDVIATPTAVVRRALHTSLDGFREDLLIEDYEFWMRALRAGATFDYESRLLVRLRAHGGNLGSRGVEVWELNHRIHQWYATDVGDPGLVRRVLAHDLRTIGRSRLGLDDVAAARTAYRSSLRHVRHPAAVLWTVALGVPGAAGIIRRLNLHRQG